MKYGFVIYMFQGSVITQTNTLNTIDTILKYQVLNLLSLF